LDQPIIFVLDRDIDRRALVRDSLRIGHERLLGELDGGVDTWGAAGLPLASVPLVQPAAVAGTVLDVRQDSEWDAGHVPGAHHVELGALTDAVVAEGPITVVCGHGERAMTGASILRAAGRDDVRVLAGGPDDVAEATGVALERS